MTVKRLFVVAVSVLLFLILAIPAGASHESGKRIRVSGVIVSLHPQGNSFWLQQRRRDGDRLWVVQINGRTKIERDDDDDDDDDDDEDRDHRRTRFWRLDVGDVVRVEGRAVGNQHILAREIEIVGHARDPISAGRAPFPQPPFPDPRFPQPPFPQPSGAPYGYAPEILSPHNGAEIATSEFTIIGRTFPGAQVHIDVLAQFALVRVAVASADVVADYSGIFTYTVRPPLRFGGATYVITATTRFQGVVSPPTSITVRQL